MTFWTIIKIVAGLVVVAVAVLTVMIVRHVRVEPMGGTFNEWIPVTYKAYPMVTLPDIGGDIPEIDPGSRVFEKAREMIATGNLAAARDRLNTVVSIYPRSRSAPEARRIVGEMNLDELLSPANMENKTLYKVVRGDSYLGIASKHDTSLDMIIYLNGLMNLKSLQPNDELLLMPLDFRLLIEPKREALSLWDGGIFVKEYPLEAVVQPPGGDLKTEIGGKSGSEGGRSVLPSSPGYRGASKVLTIDRMPLIIAALPEGEDTDNLSRGFYLSKPDMEELALLTTVGNEVEIRSSTR